MAGAGGDVRDRVLTVPNALSVLRLVLVPVFLYLLLVAHATGWAVGVLMFSGFSDWADGKIARLVAHQSSRLGELLDPAVDRIYMLVTPVALAAAGVVPWWFVIALMSGLPLVLLGQFDALWSRVILACGWAFLIWGMALYLWSAVLYLAQVG